MRNLALTIAIAICALTAPYTNAQDYLHLQAPSPTGCATQRHELMQWAQESTSKGSDLSRYEMRCKGQICVAAQKPLTGKHVYRVYPYGEQVIYYREPYYAD